MLEEDSANMCSSKGPRVELQSTLHPLDSGLSSGDVFVALYTCAASLIFVTLDNMSFADLVRLYDSNQLLHLGRTLHEAGPPLAGIPPAVAAKRINVLAAAARLLAYALPFYDPAEQGGGPLAAVAVLCVERLPSWPMAAHAEGALCLIRGTARGAVPQLKVSWPEKSRKDLAVFLLEVRLNGGRRTMRYREKAQKRWKFQKSDRCFRHFHDFMCRLHCMRTFR